MPPAVPANPCSRSAFRRTAWLLIAVGLAVAGCRGRAEFARGRDLYDQGLYRDAYRQFWEAYRISPSPEYLDAFRDAATRVAVEEGLRGRSLERDGDLEGAFASYSLALEYDDRLPALRSDYARLWSELKRKRSLVRELRGASPRTITTWEQLAAVGELSEFPAVSEEWRRRLPEAVRSVAEATIEPLLRATHAEPLPREEGRLDALIGAWRNFEDQCRLFGWREENVALAGSWEAGATSRWVEVQSVLEPFLVEAEESIHRLTAVRRALGLARRAAQKERSGDLVGALASYRRARFEFPEYEVAADGEYRVSHRFSFVTTRRIREALDEQRWEVAVSGLEELLRVTPDDTAARRQLELARRRLAESFVAAARRHADAGRPASALLFASRAAELDPSRGAGVARELRAPAVTPFLPVGSIRFRPLAADDRQLRRDLWAVDELAIGRLEAAILSSARENGEFIETEARGGEPRSRTVWIEDLEFYYSRGVALAGVDRFRYVREFGLTDNRDHHAALKGLAGARRDLSSALQRREEAGLPGRALAEELAELASWQVGQLERQVDSLPRALAEVDWSEVRHETTHLRRTARLSGFVRLGERAEWLSVSLEFLDRVAVGRPEISLASDPWEAPSREEVLLRLGRQLGLVLAERVETWRQERLEKLLREGLERLGGGDREGATESFALVHYGRRGHYPGLGRRAAEELRRLVGWIP